MRIFFDPETVRKMSFGHFCGRLSDAKCVISHFLARENVLCAPLNKKKKRHKFAVLANSPECLVAFIIFTHFLARENVLCAPLNTKTKKHKFAVLANSPECLVVFIIFVI